MATERGLGFGLTEAEAAEVQRRVRGGATRTAPAEYEARVLDFLRRAFAAPP